MVNYGEFIDRAYKLSQQFGEVSFYIKGWMELAAPEKWKEYRQMQLVEGLVTNFAEDMQTIISEKLAGISTNDFYTRLYNDGHAFLHSLHNLSKECGLEIELKKVDGPLTITDIFLEAGHIGLDDQGGIVLK